MKKVQKERTKTIYEVQNQGENLISIKKRRNDPCACGSGKKQKKCCGDKFNSLNIKPTAKSIRIKKMKEEMAEIEAKKKQEELSAVEAAVVMVAEQEIPVKTEKKLVKAIKKTKTKAENNDESTVAMAANAGQPYSDDTMQKLKSGLSKAKAAKATKTA